MLRTSLCEAVSCPDVTPRRGAIAGGSARAAGYQWPMGEVATFLVVLAVWAGIFELLRRRAGSPPVRWGWIAVIAGCAAAAWLFGALNR